jgi:two-component system NtrC family sensor kinase
MWLIFFIYLVFILIGGLSIYVGYRALLKNIVRPIKELASATSEFAEGKLNKRVHTDSQTEIGQLYQSFNEMAHKLQENDEFLRKFNEELERKVNERTIELQQANEQLRKTQDTLIRTEKIAAVGQIAAGVTHEIKNPLNSLSINAQMLLKELACTLKPESSACESASLIRFEINRINNILEEFVKFAKFPEPKFVQNDINRIINEVATFVSSEAKMANVKIDLTLPDNIPEFNFDRPQLKEVLLNLSKNAIHAMPDGGTLNIATSMEDNRININVSDTGTGITEKNLVKIFTPFFSTKEGGMGLGLATVQKIVEGHGGKIRCKSNIDKGTVFEISLPIKKNNF